MREPLVGRMRGFGTTIFAEMSALAAATGAINLGQGFPDEDGPRGVLRRAVEAIEGGRNQYPPGQGLPVLREAVAAQRLARYGQSYDPETEVLVTVGATEAVAAAVMALAGPGDEVIAFEPFYDSYAASVALSGASLRPVTLRPEGGRFTFDPDELRRAVTPRTRAVLVNSPHNPCGTVFTRQELAAIAELCVEHDLLAITDEVYEFLVYDGAEHLPLASFPGMRERTVTISSAGKTFSVTGWKTGWVCAPAPLLDAVRTVKQFLTYVGSGPWQEAVAYGLAHETAWVEGLRRSLQTKRDRLMEGLESAGFQVFRPEGTYFVQADLRPLGHADGLAFARALPGRAGVVCVPTQVFYADPAHGRHYVRFAFCKRADVIDDAVARLKGSASG
ncbi:pyridoxal phosphate-dependent aminotransferase [Actinocorallia aurea]